MDLKEREAFFKKHYENFLKSNKSKTAYCKEHLVSISAFKNWYYRFEKRKEENEFSQSNLIINSQNSSQKSFNFVEVRGVSASEATLYKIIIGKMVIEMAQLPPPQWIHDLLQLNGESLC